MRLFLKSKRSLREDQRDRTRMGFQILILCHFHDNNKKEREITREDKGHVMSHDERSKEKYKFRGEINSENIKFFTSPSVHN